MPRVDLVSIIEALYAVESPELLWLERIARATADGLGPSHRGAYALTYDASDVNDCQFPAFASTPGLGPELTHLLRVEFPRSYRSAPHLVEAVFRRIAFGPSRELPLGSDLEARHAELAVFGIDQILGLNGINVDGRGAHVGLLLRRRKADYDPDVLARLSSHLAAAARLRRRLRGEPAVRRADAVLDAQTGEVEHAERGAKLRAARDALSAAVRRLDALRGPIRRRDPEKAARQWRTLVDARWSLVDHFDTDGRRYVLAQSNEAPLAPQALLSERELQAVALAAVGHANKMIGYELGITVSTVGVLLGRAARKLGTRTRRDLIATYQAALARAPKRRP